jgi:hypothetical protein
MGAENSYNFSTSKTNDQYVRLNDKTENLDLHISLNMAVERSNEQ